MMAGDLPFRFFGMRSQKDMRSLGWTWMETLRRVYVPQSSSLMSLGSRGTVSVGIAPRIWWTAARMRWRSAGQLSALIGALHKLGLWYAFISRRATGMGSSAGWKRFRFDSKSAAISSAVISRFKTHASAIWPPRGAERRTGSALSVSTNGQGLLLLEES